MLLFNLNLVLFKKYIHIIFTMVNTSDFIERLEQLLKYYGMTSSGFADRVEVQRSSISHLLSGRNKPSLDFVLKVVKAFPEVNLYWLLNGKGTFPSDNNTISPTLPDSDQKANLKSTKQEAKSIASFENNSNKNIDKIVIFYSDGSFEAYSHHNM
ncbi:DNA-binding XRE family transcriptional regulator [Flavobacteriaceae bacterium MAR_2009_75]|nr:DNA-binding XRE family transcriptional regulator [Flavobacteriaceae bacterium MAR_2009_75]